MIGLFSSLKGFLKRQEIQIDNFICQLHYKATTLILIAFSLAVTSQQYLGSPIECHDDSKLSKDYVNTFCWITSTFSVVNSFDKNPNRNEVAYPGVDKYTLGADKIHHVYYQWVCFVLFIQAAMFYVPRWLWKTWEGGKAGKILYGLNNPMLSDDEMKSKITRLVQYLLDHKTTHNFYAYKYFFCESLNFVNVIGQIYFLDKFLGGEFKTFGLRVFDFMNGDQSIRVDPMVLVFPRLTKCTLQKFGSSGDVERISALCVLPLNVFNEKIYAFMWFWFVGLAAITGLVVAYRVFLFGLPIFRVYALRTLARTVPMQEISNIMDHSQIGDWFLIYTLGRNAEPMNFKQLLIEYSFNLKCEETTDRVMTEHQFMDNQRKGGMEV